MTVKIRNSNSGFKKQFKPRERKQKHNRLINNCLNQKSDHTLFEIQVEKRSFFSKNTLVIFRLNHSLFPAFRQQGEAQDPVLAIAF